MASGRDQSVHRIELATGDTELVADGFAQLRLGALEFDPMTRTVWVADLGAGVNYQLCLGTTVSVTPPARPARGSLALSVHPNPANSTQWIAFTLATSSPVRVDVFDLQGRLVKTVAEGLSPRLECNRITWDGADAAGQSVSPGVYRVRARAGGHEVSKALVRVR